MKNRRGFVIQFNFFLAMVKYYEMHSFLWFVSGNIFKFDF